MRDPFCSLAPRQEGISKMHNDAPVGRVGPQRRGADTGRVEDEARDTDHVELRVARQAQPHAAARRSNAVVESERAVVPGLTPGPETKKLRGRVELTPERDGPGVVQLQFGIESERAVTRHLA